MWYMVTTFVNHLQFEGRSICRVDGFYFLSCSCLPILHLFMFLGSALDVPLNMKIPSFYPDFDKIPNHENSGNCPFWVGRAPLQTEDGPLVDFRKSANALRSVLLCWEEILKEMPESRWRTTWTRRWEFMFKKHWIFAWLNDYKLLKKAYDSHSCDTGLLV